MVYFTLITFLPSYVAPVYSYVTNVSICDLSATVYISMYLYVSCLYSHVFVCRCRYNIVWVSKGELLITKQVK